MSPSVSQTLHEYWELACRQKWVIAGCIVLGLVVAGALCKILPKSYRSSTLILVEDQKIPEDYVRGIVGGSVQERITMIQQQVLSRTLLTQIIQEFGLDKGVKGQEAREALIDRMRGSIQVTTVGSGNRRGRIEAFTIAFEHESPAMAMKVTSRLASAFIDENIKQREQFVEGAAMFLDHELVSARQELERKEAEISQFKKQHIGELPEQMEANLRTLDRMQNEKFQLAESMQRLHDDLANIQRARADYAETGRAIPGLAAIDGKAGHLFRRLKEVEQQLLGLSAEYKDTYPDIILAKQEIGTLKSELASIYAEEGDKDLETLDPYLRELKKKDLTINNELAYLKQRQDRLMEKSKEYERRVEQAPALEQELLILMRDYQNLKKNYSSLLQKRLNARIAENLENRQKGERFRVLDPANLPATAHKPDQLRIMLLGFAGGSAVGGGLAFLLELLSPTFRRPEDVEQGLGQQVLAAIPHFLTVYGSIKETARKAARSTAENGSPDKDTVRPRTHRKERANICQELPVQMNLVAKRAPSSIAAEQYRVAATRLSLLEAARQPMIVGVTSPVKGDGKTTTAVNLAYTFARDLAKRTVVVECDFKHPILHQYLDHPYELGVTDLLNDKKSWKGSFRESLSRIDEVSCWVLPAGNEAMSFGDLSKTEELRCLLKALRDEFEYVLINMPPVLPLADMNLLAGLTDVLILIVRAGSTPQQVVERALTMLGPSLSIHIILNAVEPSTMPSYMYYAYPSESVGNVGEQRT